MPRLYVVATPIGNLSDISPRVRDALARADLVAAEDTRVAMKLLNHLGLTKPTISCHRHNEERRSEPVVERMLSEDLAVALTCDAGTPAISDPGYLLVDAAWKAGIEVTPVPGPSAVVTALSVCGFDTREFAFYGFLPREKKPLAEKLGAIRRSGVPVAVIYESPHRIVRLLEAVCAALPGCAACVCCDLTKLYERVDRGRCEDVLCALKQRENTEKGEYCVVLDLSMLPPEQPEAPELPAEAVILQGLLDGKDLDEACAAAREGGISRNELYKARERVRSLLADRTSTSESRVD